jgi:NAD(P)-dependent dehydrogenase (short-subunit alcohol dehydrogenase family)
LQNELRFEGRTAIVTGAGGNPSLGRSFALLLASRGANVVVNDVGHVPDVLGYEDDASAHGVAQEIRALGGNAVADTHSVATEEGAAALIQATLDAFGTIDILINNAAICIVAPFDVITSHDYQAHIDVNLMGPIWTSRAVWPHMRSQGYGRIVSISSGAFTGVAWMNAYGTTKGGLFALTRSLAAEGAAFGIKANVVNPTAFTRMVPTQQYESSVLYQELKKNLPPELAAPMVAYLAHDSCPVNGECFDAAGGHVSRTYVAQTRGFSDRDLTIEKIVDRWREIMDPTGSRVINSGETDPSKWNVKPYRPR